MGIFDKAKDLVSENEDKIDEAIDKAAEIAKDKLPDQHAAKVDTAASQAKKLVDNID